MNYRIKIAISGTYSLKLLVLSFRGSGEEQLLVINTMIVLVSQMLALIVGNFHQTGVQSESAWTVAMP